MTPPRPSLAAAVSAMAFFGYMAVGRVVVDLFPFSTLAMYSSSHASGTSRILARDASGRAHELDRFDRWRCPASLDPAAGACAGFAGATTIDYVDRDMGIFLDAHRAPASDPGAAPVDVVRRAWQLTDRPGPPAHRDCVLLRCRASRVP